MSEWTARNEPIASVARASVGAQTDAVHSHDMGTEPMDLGEGHMGPMSRESGYHDEGPSAVGSGLRHGMAVGKALGYVGGAAAGALGGVAAGAAMGGYHALSAAGSLLTQESDETHEAHETHEHETPAAAQPVHQDVLPAYLQDRDAVTPQKKRSFIEKERQRIKDAHESTGEHPFHPWGGHHSAFGSGY